MPVVHFPTLHADQVAAFHAKTQFFAVRCGRRWGKTVYGEVEGGDTAIRGFPVGFFAPDYKILTETYQEFVDLLDPVIKTASSPRGDGVIRLTTGGRIDFWTLENERAGRSRKYKKVIIDEAAFAKPNAMDIWTKSIKPTLYDLSGSALVLSNTNGDDPENFLWRICNQPEHGFTSYHAPTSANPLLPLRLPHESDAEHAARRATELEKLQTENHPLVYAQEYLAEFVSWAGAGLFNAENLLVNGEPIETPMHIDTVYAVVDTAVKIGKEHDGTAVVYFGRSNYSGTPVVVLDYDLVQIEGSLLEAWIPQVFQRCEALAASTRARLGSVGVFIEDAQSGTILLQQSQRRNLPVHAIESGLTALGKDARAINVSGYVYQDKVKFTRDAYNKTTSFKNTTRNHLWSQVMGFRVGDKQAATRADDLLDCFTYGVALALGNSGGF